MYISQTLEAFYKDYENVNLILDDFKKAGFDAYDFSFCKVDFVLRDDYIDFAKRTREHADKIGLVCNQAHAPFPTCIQYDDEFNIKMFECIIRSMEAASILGAKVIVIHPWNNYRYKQNIKLYKTFLPYAKKYNIKIGVENMWNQPVPGGNKVTPCACSLLDDYLKTMKGLDSKYFVACLDIGHAEMFDKGYSSILIKGLNKYLGALHIHDNDLIHDNHWIPGEGKIDFNQIVGNLISIDYKGDITLEVLSSKDKLSNHLKELAAFASDIRKKIQGD